MVKTRQSTGKGCHDEMEAGEDWEIRAYRALFRAIITQHIMDAKSCSKKPDAAYSRDRANFWLFEDREGFPEVCDYAGFDHEVIREKLKKARERGYSWRESRKKQETSLERVEGACYQNLLIAFGLFENLKEQHKPRREIVMVKRRYRENRALQFEMVF